MLVYLALFTLVMGAVAGAFLWLARANVRSRAVGETLDNARRAFDVMAHDIREARSIYTPTASATQLSIETANNLPAGEDMTYVDFYRCGTQVCVKREGQIAAFLTSDSVEVENLEFQQVGTTTPAVHIHLAMRSKNQTGRIEEAARVELVTTAALRSY